MSTTKFDAAIRRETVKILFEQIKSVLWTESLGVIAVTMILYGAVNTKLLFSWLVGSLLICGLWRPLMVYQFQKALKESDKEINFTKWLNIFAFGAFLSGLSWGLVGSILMVQNDLLRQTTIIFFLFGATSAANSIYSASRFVYAAFLFPTFVPFAIWLLLQGLPYSILGVLALVYIGLMMSISFNANKIIINSLKLRFEKSDLITFLEGQTLQLAKSLAMVKATLESTTDAILVLDSNNNIEDYNKNFRDLWNITSNLQGQSLETMVQYLNPQLANPQIFINKMQLPNPKNSSGESFDEVFLTDGRIVERYSRPQKIGEQAIGRVWSFRDVTGRKNLESKLFHKANFDSLTDLPNRALLLDRTKQAITQARHLGKKCALLFADLDQFKIINDSLGHTFGDKILRIVATRLVNCVNENDTVSREGGDEFIVILSLLDDEAEVIAQASNILKKIREPILIESKRLNITISLGISFYPKDGQDAESLIRNADIAMYHAKELGRNNFQFFTEEMNQKVFNRLILENQLREALGQHEFALAYQPIVSLKTGRITGLEALLRWRHPKTVVVPTPEFIELAEETGLIVPIGEWVLQTACLQWKEFYRQGFKDLYLAINLSARQFNQSNFLHRLKTIILETGIDPHFLALELTESILMTEVEKNVEILKNLKSLGVCIVIDDFGTGYSSLNYLKNLPVDKLKIDQSFIQDIPHHLDDAAITAAIIALAAQLNLKVVAEGVENKDQIEFLMLHHCDEIQGFYFSEPLTDEDCLVLLKQKKHLFSMLKY